VAESLRAAAAAKRDEILDRDGRLEEGERRFFAAAMAEVRVGVDGGSAYYGNVGSYERMSNAVIGAKVDPAARLGRMARAYRVPVLCSRFVKDDAEASGGAFRFVELDRLRAAGTRDEESIFWPLPAASMDGRLAESLERFSAGQEAYYAGDWAAASRAWAGVDLPFAGVFRERVAGGKRPEGWDGAWTTT
jgi:class 3 adenylate cyclase